MTRQLNGPHMLRVVLFSILVVGLCAGSRAQEPAAPPAFDAARIATEREPAVATIEVRGFFASFGASDARIRFQFRYRAPNESRFGK